ncbi:MAG: DNA translocase FtsK 4TM domain-containing protein [Candidatus Spechtbacterales bacterium]
MEKNKRGGKNKKDKRRAKFDIHSEVVKALWGVVFIVLFFIAILAFAGKAGSAGSLFSKITEALFGLGRFGIPFVFLAASYIFFGSGKRNSYVPLIMGGLLFFSGILGILNIFSQEGSTNGGYWGYFVSLPFIGYLGNIASFVIFLGFIIAAIIVSFNVRIGKLIEHVRGRAEKEKTLSSLNSSDLEQSGSDINKKERPTEFKVKTWQSAEAEGAEQRGHATSESHKARNDKEDFAVKDIQNIMGDFRLPPLELLEKETGRPSSGDIVANANIIKRTLQNFGIEVEMDEVNVGPAVTQFTLKPAEGVKLSRISALHNDLSLALAAHPIRIEAPVPGRSLVGIEIPNKGFALVRMKNMLESSEFKKRSSNLTLSFGRDVSGAAILGNLAKMPHILIAGSTGSGKTICLNGIIISLLYQSPPNLLKFILIDPKRVEFPVYSDIPHLLAPVVVDTQKTVNALKWAVSEMERRFELLASVKVRDIVGFNSDKKAIEAHGPIPYIVIIIDELADLMSGRGKEIEALIVRLAQMARAVGIHLVLATQRPSVEVITGLIKANITTRIAFQVASQIDSRTVLDMAGAEKLLGNGDMLYLAGDASKPKRVQGAYVTEKEIRRVADYLRESAGSGKESVESVPDITYGQGGEITDERFDFDEIDEGRTDDELYEAAKKVVIQSQKASASLLQRRLRVGYARAARLIDMLEGDGVVGPGDGAKPRDVYVGVGEGDDGQ